MKEQYFEVYNGEEGVEVKIINDLEKYLKIAVKEKTEFLSDFPKLAWDNCKKFDRDCEWESRVIIKGKIVVPVKKQVVTEYEIEVEY